MTLTLALLLDALLGEPRWLWSRWPHPAVLMGRAVAWCDARFNAGPNRQLKGLLTITMLATATGTLGLIISALPLGWLWSALGAAILLAQRSLVQHVQAVADALRYGLSSGRSSVAMIVGRDTAEMSESEIARAAIESAAENLSDGVVAPAFWFLALGLPGILIYKTVNTADSMIGHRTPRHEEFGKAAAILDDILNWVPARLTALLIALAHGAPRAWTIARREAHLHRSPNAGWPEAAMAGVLNIALSGPRSYHGERQDFPFVNPTGRRSLGPADIDATAAALWRTWALMVALIFALALF
ncbi:cobalamin biosynthesis protein [Roseobacter sp. HKCCD9010]|uniref:adenosylcobinamide-phosphate synthase CbiB n=1 Tax=unclassified Roseobacter TaxID=196798 RepID=UPI001491DA32|nr:MULTISPECIES: adenosylcobinamide-phosphate synthase CbiB [unclassified Roseobacter]MBF9051128.1 cobalamin biosynthesis protein [Rhodobacterales bacterium HKCCD4356]NNV12897.1 cobalamin biosynthesis protein [Roseobacter sp. HKCCD7357]NNV16842.1 cobalamin biosynthesis protein [Roseobacter sp. HKCCD8768]NNV26526.1 cobalamin biosynthesis protein [Roseobacter sp. HKCCD8192]NNV30563.1 cobalamin biosynthesis protein [Roseobacter sp. HKCCD9061]